METFYVGCVELIVSMFGYIMYLSLRIDCFSYFIPSNLKLCFRSKMVKTWLC